MEQDIKTQLLTKRPIDLLFQLSIPAVIGMIVIGLYYRLSLCELYTVCKHGYAWRRTDEKSHDDYGAWCITQYYS